MGEPTSKPFPDPAQQTAAPSQQVIPAQDLVQTPPASSDGLLYFTPEQATVLLSYMAQEHGLSGIKIHMEYSDLIPNQPPLAVVRVQADELKHGLNGDALISGFFRKLSAEVSGNGIHFSDIGFECQNPTLLSGVIIAQLVGTDLHNTKAINEYLVAHNVAPLPSPTVKALPTPAVQPMIEAPVETQLDLGLPERGGEEQLDFPFTMVSDAQPQGARLGHAPQRE